MVSWNSIVSLTVGLCCYSAAIEFIAEPFDTMVNYGETVILRCAIKDQGKIPLYWQNTDTQQFISMDREIDPYRSFGNKTRERLSVVGDSRYGEYNLRIDNVTNLDAGSYACLYIDVFGYYSRYAVVKVVNPPEKDYPMCMMSPATPAAIGDSVDLLCVSSGGKPAPILKWTTDGKPLNSAYVSGGVGGVTSNKYTMKLTEDDRGKIFTCKATHEAFIVPKTCSIIPIGFNIPVYLRPQIKYATEGRRATFACYTDKSLEPTFHWYLGNNLLDADDPRITPTKDGVSKLKLRNLRINDNGTHVYCVITNRFGAKKNDSSLLLVFPTYYKGGKGTGKGEGDNQGIKENIIDNEKAKVSNPVTKSVEVVVANTVLKNENIEPTISSTPIKKTTTPITTSSTPTLHDISNRKTTFVPNYSNEESEDVTMLPKDHNTFEWKPNTNVSPDIISYEKSYVIDNIIDLTQTTNNEALVLDATDIPDRGKQTDSVRTVKMLTDSKADILKATVVESLDGHLFTDANGKFKSKPTKQSTTIVASTYGDTFEYSELGQSVTQTKPTDDTILKSDYVTTTISIDSTTDKSKIIPTKRTEYSTLKSNQSSNENHNYTYANVKTDESNSDVAQVTEAQRTDQTQTFIAITNTYLKTGKPEIENKPSLLSNSSKKTMNWQETISNATVTQTTKTPTVLKATGQPVELLTYNYKEVVPERFVNENKWNMSQSPVPNTPAIETTNHPTPSQEFATQNKTTGPFPNIIERTKNVTVIVPLSSNSLKTDSPFTDQSKRHISQISHRSNKTVVTAVESLNFDNNDTDAVNNSLLTTQEPVGNITEHFITLETNNTTGDSAGKTMNLTLTTSSLSSTIHAKRLTTELQYEISTQSISVNQSQLSADLPKQTAKETNDVSRKTTKNPLLTTVRDSTSNTVIQTTFKPATHSVISDIGLLEIHSTMTHTSDDLQTKEYTSFTNPITSIVKTVMLSATENRFSQRPLDLGRTTQRTITNIPARSKNILTKLRKMSTISHGDTERTTVFTKVDATKDANINPHLQPKVIPFEENSDHIQPIQFVTDSSIDVYTVNLEKDALIPNDITPETLLKTIVSKQTQIISDIPVMPVEKNDASTFHRNAKIIMAFIVGMAVFSACLLTIFSVLIKCFSSENEYHQPRKWS